MADEGHSDLTVALAFLTGSLLGAGIALLLAPRTGAELRAQVGEWLQDLREKAREAAGRGGDDDEDDVEAAPAPPRGGRKPATL